MKSKSIHQNLKQYLNFASSNLRSMLLNESNLVENDNNYFRNEMDFQIKIKY